MGSDSSGDRWLRDPSRLRFGSHLKPDLWIRVIPPSERTRKPDGGFLFFEEPPGSVPRQERPALLFFPIRNVLVQTMAAGKSVRSLEDLSQLIPGSTPVPAGPPAPAKQQGGKKGHDGKGKRVQVRIERAGRKGKTVTIVAGLQHNPGTIEEIARMLKQHCGAGGTVKDALIEIQGDNRERVAGKLREMNYTVTG
jgi:translation initiation factor 1